jgi:hypothetical protein
MAHKECRASPWDGFGEASRMCIKYIHTDLLRMYDRIFPAIKPQAGATI